MPRWLVHRVDDVVPQVPIPDQGTGVAVWPLLLPPGRRRTAAAWQCNCLVLLVCWLCTHQARQKTDLGLFGFWLQTPTGGVTPGRTYGVRSCGYKSHCVITPAVVPEQAPRSQSRFATLLYAHTFAASCCSAAMLQQHRTAALTRHRTGVRNWQRMSMACRSSSSTPDCGKLRSTLTPWAPAKPFWRPWWAGRSPTPQTSCRGALSSALIAAHSNACPVGTDPSWKPIRELLSSNVQHGLGTSSHICALASAGRTRWGCRWVPYLFTLQRYRPLLSSLMHLNALQSRNVNQSGSGRTS